MPPLTLASALQVVLGLGLLNVWILRRSSPTRFRGCDARDLKQEFHAYGLPTWFFYLVGTLKVGAALMLLVGLWVPELVLPASLLLVALMLGALAMHIKVGDPLIKFLPALAMLAMSAGLLGLAL